MLSCIWCRMNVIGFRIDFVAKCCRLYRRSVLWYFTNLAMLDPWPWPKFVTFDFFGNFSMNPPGHTSGSLVAIQFGNLQFPNSWQHLKSNDLFLLLNFCDRPRLNIKCLNSWWVSELKFNQLPLWERRGERQQKNVCIGIEENQSLSSSPAKS